MPVPTTIHPTNQPHAAKYGSIRRSPFNPPPSDRSIRNGGIGHFHGGCRRVRLPSFIGINRLFRFDDLVAHCGAPDSPWEKLRPLLPVFTTHHGEPIYLESEGNDFLKFVRDDSLSRLFSSFSQPPRYCTVRYPCIGSRNLLENTAKMTHHLPMQKRLKMRSSRSSV